MLYCKCFFCKYLYTLLFFILRGIDFWICSVINFTDKNIKSSDSLFFYLQENGESAKNSIINKNSFKPEFFGCYLVGLFEGDGHMGLSKPIKEGLKVKNSSPFIAITFFNKDLTLINKLLDKFGGRLRFKDKENAIVWTIGAHKELINMINLLNLYYLCLILYHLYKL